MKICGGRYISILLLLSGLTLDTARSQGSFFSAKIIESSGAVRCKRKGTFVWEPVRIGELLEMGDKVFVGNASFASLVYKSNGSILTMKSWSLLQIEDAPRLRSQFQATAQQSEEISNKSKNGGKENELYHSVIRDRKKLLEDAKNGIESSAGLVPAQKKALETIRNQNKDLAFSTFLPLQFISAKNLLPKNKFLSFRFPTYFSALFDNLFRDAVCEGTLKDRNTLKVLWQETHIGGFRRVVVPRAGQFTFQFYCNDQSLTGVPLEIDFAKYSEDKFFEALRDLKFQNLAVAE